MVGRPSRLVGMPFRMSGSGREALLNVRESLKALSDVQLWSGVPTGFRGVVGRPTGKSGCERETLPDVRLWSGGLPGSPGMVGRSSQMYRSLRGSLPDVRVWSVGPLGSRGMVGRPSRK